MFPAALLIGTKNCRKVKCPSTSEMDKQSEGTSVQWTTAQRKEQDAHTKCPSLRCMVPSARSQTQKVSHCRVLFI